MAIRRASPERLGAFSDGVIAVIITIMVLELKAGFPVELGGATAMHYGRESYEFLYHGSLRGGLSPDHGGL